MSFIIQSQQTSGMCFNVIYNLIIQLFLVAQKSLINKFSLLPMNVTILWKWILKRHRVIKLRKIYEENKNWIPLKSFKINKKYPIHMEKRLFLVPGKSMVLKRQLKNVSSSEQYFQNHVYKLYFTFYWHNVCYQISEFKGYTL